METGFAIFTLAVIGLFVGMIQIYRTVEQQQKLERVPVRVKRDSSK